MHNKTLTLLGILILVSTASATEMSFGDVFTECDVDASWMECGAMLLVPNLHIKAFWTLVMGNIFRVFNLTEYLTFDIISVFIDNLWGVLSGIAIYLIILMMEFVKSYVMLGSILVCWNIAFSYLGMSGDRTIAPDALAIWTGVIMVIGSIALLMYDWSSAVSIMGGA